MAGKNGSGTAWVPAQGDALLQATRAAVAAMEAKYDEVQKIFAQIRSDDVIGESETKDALLIVLDDVDSTFDTLKNRLDEVRKTVDEIAQIANDAANTNVRNTEEAQQATTAASRKAATVDGTGSNA